MNRGKMRMVRESDVMSLLTRVWLINDGYLRVVVQVLILKLIESEKW